MSSKIMLLLLLFMGFVECNCATKKIYLSFVNTHQIDPTSISQEVSKVFNVKTEIITTFTDLEFAYIKSRQQYLADKILSNGINFLPKDALVLVFVVEKDIFSYGYNFIFGQSAGKVCVVSINRFLPCSKIDTQSEKQLVNERTVKTIVHEIGHSLGLAHCKDPFCVMFFSNWVGDTDRKRKDFCCECKKKLNCIYAHIR